MPLTPDSKFRLRFELIKEDTEEVEFSAEYKHQTYGQAVAIQAAALDGPLELGIIQAEALGQMPEDVRDVIAAKRAARAAKGRGGAPAGGK